MFLGDGFGQQVKILMSKRYDFYSLFVPSPKEPLMFRIFIYKTRIVPRCMSLSLAPIES